MKEVDINQVAKNLSTLLPTLDRKLIRPFEQQARHLVSPLAIHVMSILSEKHSFTMTELADEIKIAKPQLTPIIDKLIASNWVCREQDCKDRRIVKIKITFSGIELLDNLQKDIINSIKTKIEGLDKEDLFLLDKALNQLYTVINKIF